MVDVRDCVAAELFELIHGEHGWTLDLAEPIPDSELHRLERELGVKLPRSYRSFLRYFGSARIGVYDLFGLPRNRLWGDLVLMNQLAEPMLPFWCLRFARDRRGRDYCFDTSWVSPDGEFPVVVLGLAPGGTTVARNFMDFLRGSVAGER